MYVGLLIQHLLLLLKTLLVVEAEPDISLGIILEDIHLNWLN